MTAVPISTATSLTRRPAARRQGSSSLLTSRALQALELAEAYSRSSKTLNVTTWLKDVPAYESNHATHEQGLAPASQVAPASLPQTSTSGNGEEQQKTYDFNDSLFHTFCM